MATFNPQTVLTQASNGKSTLTFQKKQVLFSQGDLADAVFYLQSGKVKLTVVSPRGKEAVIVILEQGSFFGEECLAGQPVHLATATVVEDARIVRIDKSSMRRLLHDDHPFSALFTAYMLTRNIRVQEDLVDQLFNSSEKRLARALLLMAHLDTHLLPAESSRRGNSPRVDLTLPLTPCTLIVLKLCSTPPHSISFQPTPAKVRV